MVLNTTNTIVDVTRLLPGITYNFTVVAYNEFGNSPPSDVTPVRTLDEGTHTHSCSFSGRMPL